MKKPFSPPKIWIPTEFSELDRPTAGDVVSFCGCENSSVSKMVVKAVEDFSKSPAIYIDHWNSQDNTLRKELADLHGVSPSQVFLTSGAMEGIRYVFEIFVDTQTKVGLLKPDFPGFVHFAQKARVSPQWLEKKDFPFTFSVEEIVSFTKDKGVDFLILSNPSAATGTLHDTGAIEKLVSSTEAIIVDDEADAITTNSSAHLTNKYKNLVVLRSFSKFYGLAGLRIGYLICPKELKQHFENTINPIELTSLAIVAARAVLKDGEFQKQTQDTVEQNRIALENALQGTPYKLVPNSRCFASYLWADGNVEDPYKTLLKQNVRILESKNFGLSRGGRVNLSNKDDIQYLVKVVRQLFSKQ